MCNVLGRVKTIVLLYFLLISTLLLPTFSVEAQWKQAGFDGSIISDFKIDPINPKILYAIAEHEGIYKTTNSGKTWFSASEGITSGIFWWGSNISINPEKHQEIYCNGQWLLTPPYISSNSGRTWKKMKLPNPRVYGLQLWNIDETPVFHPVDNKVRYLSTEYGILKTEDSAKTWRMLNNPGGGQGHCKLIIANRNPKILYAYSWDGLYKSTNAGETWKHLSSTNFWAMVINPKNNNILYGATQSGILKSTNGGKSWIFTNNGLTEKKVLAIAIDPKRPSILYAGTQGGGVFRSTTSGLKWLEINNGLKEQWYLRVSCTNIQIDPINTKNVFISLGDAYNSDPSGIYVSTNSGL